MPTISPYLDGLLTQWADQTQALRKETAFQKEVIDPIALAAHGNRIATSERRKRDLRKLEQTVTDAQMRWDERLNRVEEWKNAVLRLREEETRLQKLLEGSVWLEKARTYQDAFIQHLERGAQRVEVAQYLLHDNLENWQTVLQERERVLQDLLAKAEQTEGPFYVSRARKQPEVDFLNEHMTASEAFGYEIRAMRQFLNHLRGRLSKALTTIEHRTSGAEIFYELHKQELLSALKNAETLLNTRREKVLSEALIYEGGKHLLRKIQGLINGLRCIEDISQPKRGFKKFLN